MEQQLVLGNEIGTGVSIDEAEELKKLQQTFIESYIVHKNDMQIDKWLQMELMKQLPDKNKEEILEMTSDIIEQIQMNEKNRKSVEDAMANGRSKESWFASAVKKSTSHMSMQESAKYLHGLDDALKTANESMQIVITSKRG